MRFQPPAFHVADGKARINKILVYFSILHHKYDYITGYTGGKQVATYITRSDK